MKLKSLALRTDLIFDRFSGTVIDRGNHLVVRTDARPDYFWGNCLIMAHPPVSSDFEKWLDLFEREIGPREERGFFGVRTEDAPGADGGALVRELLSDSAAIKAGVEVGDVLLKVNNRRVENAQDFNLYMRSRRIEDQMTIEIKGDERPAMVAEILSMFVVA